MFITLADDSWQRAYHAFVIAAGALSLGREVVLFAGGKSVLALTKKDGALKEAPSALELSEKGLASLADLREAAQMLGITLLACESGLRLAGLTEDDLLEGVEVRGVVSFLIEAGQSPLLAL